jgi:hypothetical protein
MPKADPQKLYEEILCSTTNSEEIANVLFHTITSAASIERKHLEREAALLTEAIAAIIAYSMELEVGEEEITIFEIDDLINVAKYNHLCALSQDRRIPAQIRAPIERYVKVIQLHRKHREAKTLERSLRGALVRLYQPPTAEEEMAAWVKDQTERLLLEIEVSKTPPPPKDVHLEFLEDLEIPFGFRH